jgi:hypothetical protein
MRRISLALALFGAVAAAGCGGGAKPSSTAATKGTAGVNFTVTLNNQGGGTVSDGTNTCAADTTCSWTYATGTTVTLTATAGSLYFNGWFGDCQGTSTCAIAGNADKYVVSYFSATPQAHPNFVDPALHAPAYFSFQSGVTGALTCTQCHGAQLQGQGIAPSCNQCHNLTLVPSPAPTATGPSSAWGGTIGTDHFNFTQGGCGPCHSNSGILTSPGIGFTSAQATALLNGAAALPYTCVTCHNSISDPVWGSGVTTLTFPGKAVVTTSKVVGLCGQCHLGRTSGNGTGTSTVDSKIGAKLPGDFTITSPADPHFFVAAGVMMGSNSNAAYQYSGQTYATTPPFYNTAAGSIAAAPGPHGSPHGANCTQCHSANGIVHFQKVDTANTLVPPPFPGFTSSHFPAGYPTAGAACDSCHSTGPYGRSLEATRANIGALSAQLLTKLNAYLTTNGKSAICFRSFDPSHNEFYLTTANGGGLCGATDTTKYNTFDSKSLKASFNLALVLNDPGAFAHNGDYVTQALIDSINDLGGTVPCDAAPPASPKGNAADSSCMAAQLTYSPPTATSPAVYVLTADGNPGYVGTAIPRP